MMQDTTVLFDETKRLLALSIEHLKQMFNVSGILSDAEISNEQNFSKNFNKSNVNERIKALENELIKIDGRETVLAVIGTMKAGKSTTINAIVGKEILPNHNQPMTSVPTLIRHVPGKTEPVLYLKHIQGVGNLLTKLNEKKDTPEGQEITQELQKNGNTCNLLEILSKDTWLKNEYSGEKEIFTGLTLLNNLVRLAREMDVAFPFDEYAEVQNLPVIEVEFSHLVGMNENHGTLTLLDTPGPNEAGQPQMEGMMREQLQKASAVLAVMDYTQMKSKADEDVRKELNAIADISAGRLFVLVNKFDEKDRNGDGADAVCQNVPAMLNNNVLPATRVYPGSSRQAYLANRALQELQKNGALPAGEGWVRDFVREAFGAMVEEDDWKNSTRVKKRAEKLWEGSLLDKLIREVIQNAYSGAAVTALESAVAKLIKNATEVNETLSIRKDSLNKSVDDLLAQINSLQADINAIDECQRKVDSGIGCILKKICEETNRIIKDAKESLDGILEEAKADVDSNKFNNDKESREWIRKFISSVDEQFNKAGEQLLPELENTVKELERCLHNTATDAINEIATRVNNRLGNDGFTININFPSVSELHTQLLHSVDGADFSHLLEKKEIRERKLRRASGWWGTLCRLFNTNDWGWELYTVGVSHDSINISAVQKEVQNRADEYIKKLNDAIEHSLTQSVQQTVDDFFTEFKGKIEQLNSDFHQTLNEHERSHQEKKNLKECLQASNEIVLELISDSKTLKEELELMQ
ncbi:dynamin family protein [Escherichia coli]|uniref:dynamin family protein n=1 Tax=Escherichia coli TaxID=562 RepID=UPI002AB9BC5C|nr:dynamin family protein [Escherichia coli]MDZ3971379.1 dynamin family protein [Escherichia coli]